MKILVNLNVFLPWLFLLIRWFAKRFLHPDIVAEYGYIFIWDEDLGVENFHPDKYVEHFYLVLRIVFLWTLYQYIFFPFLKALNFKG